MLYSTLQIGNEEFHLRLTTQDILALERSLGNKSLLKVLMVEEILPLDTTLKILHASLNSFHHGYTREKVDDLYSAWVESGKTYTELTSAIVDIMKVSGFFSGDQMAAAEAEMGQ